MDGGITDASLSDGATDASPVDANVATPDAGDPPTSDKGGCNCQATGGGGAGLLPLGLVLLGLWIRRRRRGE